jgi:formylmethanofuran dehydrogenase subunit E
MSTKAAVESLALPEWTWEFHGHKCPLMPIGFRMGKLAMRELGIERVKDHGAFALSEMGIGHPQTCMMDGIQSATGCTYGKLLMERLNYGKLAMVLYKPGKGAVRVSVKPEFSDELGKQEFFAYRKKGVEPSEIPSEVVATAIAVVTRASDQDMFRVEKLTEFQFDIVTCTPRFGKAKCSKCGEYAFERYLRYVDGKPFCIPCSGYKQ